MYLHNTYGRMNKDYTVYTLCLHNIITHYYENICFVFIFSSSKECLFKF
jgi:hypothetical protein